MDFIIHTYGYIDAMYYVLNSIAMFRNSGFFTLILEFTAGMVGVCYAVKMAYNSNYIKPYLVKMVGMITLLNGILLPTSEMYIKDHVSKRMEKVDNIPLIFALPVGYLEEFGHILTIGFEQVFAPIETAVNPQNPVFSYYNYGMLFGARLRSELSQVRIKDLEFIHNMQVFTKQCIVLPAMIGWQFTKEELMKVPDMWKLVSSKAGTLVRMDMYRNGQLTRLSCKEAVPYFEEYFTREEERLINKFKDSDFAKATNSQKYGASTPLGTIFKKNISAVYGGNYSASEALKQQMMVNFLGDYVNHRNSYGAARGKMQQESSWLLSSSMANYYLPMLLVLLKSIAYASFVFLMPLILFSGGLNRYGSWLTGVASLQLWASLNAVINMIMGTYSNLSQGSNLLISFSSNSTITNHVDTIVSVAAGMQVLVPFLAFAIMQGGMNGLSHLAGSIIGVLQSTTGAIGGEIATGNRSLDNVSTGNVARYNSSGFKHDSTMMYADNTMSMQLSDRTMMTRNPDGNSIFTGGAGRTHSSGSTSYTLEDTTSSQSGAAEGYLKGGLKGGIKFNSGETVVNGLAAVPMGTGAAVDADADNITTRSIGIQTIGDNEHI